MKYSLDKYKYFHYVNKDTGIDTVAALSTYAGRTVRGEAKCDPKDEFSLEKGKKLAAARCNLKIAEKRAKRATRKAEEAAHIVAEASKHYTDMISYHTDSLNELAEARNYLSDLLNHM